MNQRIAPPRNPKPMCQNRNSCGNGNPIRGACTCGGHCGGAGDINLRPAQPGDVPTLLALVGELAAYESLGHEFEATADLFMEHFFGSNPRARALLAFRDGAPVGFAVWFPTYSTFCGKPGAFVEDLYVRPPVRRQGLGRALLSAVAADARSAGCVRLEWRTLKWNDTALGFYHSLGAETLSEWLTLRLNEPHLSGLSK